MGRTFGGNMKNLLASELIKSSILSQKEALEELEKKHRILMEQYQKSKHGDNLTGEEIRSMLTELYKEARAVQRPFGETVEEIMREKGITKRWGGKKILDVTRAEEVTGLDSEIFRKKMYRADCVPDMATVMSMCIGFKLDSVCANRLLQAAGLTFRLDNPDHIAYLFLLSYCKDWDINQCNEWLEKLGVRKSRQLGSRHRERKTK